MKNKIFGFFLSLFVASQINAQQSTNDIGNVRQMAKEIIEATGIKANFEIRQANVPNAAAVLYAGKRYIFYNPAFFERINRASGTRWAAASVLAHEIGHHAKSRIVNERIRMGSELEADEFSGFALRKMGASLEDAQAAINVFSKMKATSTHPAAYNRLTSIANGWEDANDDAGTREILASNSMDNEPGEITNEPRGRYILVIIDRD